MRLIAMFMAILSLWGFTPRDREETPSKIVSQVQVTAAVGEEIQTFTYTRQEKMREILNYLRLLKPDLRRPMDPETFRTDAYEIRLTMLDGREVVYYQIYDLYLRKNEGPWYTISPVDGSMLHPLLLSLPSDMP